MVRAAYTLRVRAALLLNVIPFSILSSNFSPSPASTAVFGMAWFSYFGWAGMQFHGGPKLGSWARAAAAAALTQTAVLLIVGVGNRACQSLAGACRGAITGTASARAPRATTRLPWQPAGTHRHSTRG